jgi:hypothetical protein
VTKEGLGVEGKRRDLSKESTHTLALERERELARVAYEE